MARGLSRRVSQPQGVTSHDIVFEWDRIATRILPWNPTCVFLEEDRQFLWYRFEEDRYHLGWMCGIDLDLWGDGRRRSTPYRFIPNTRPKTDNSLFSPATVTQESERPLRFGRSDLSGKV